MTVPGGYVRRSVTLHTAVADQIATLNALAQAGNRQYAMQLLRVNDAGTELEDLTPYVVTPAAASIVRDCTAEAHARLTLTLGKKLTWGLDRIAPLSLVSSPAYQGGAWHAFPRGIFVATSPGLPDLTHAAAISVTGWDRLYLLQGQPAVTFSFAAGSTYLAAVTALFRDAGVLGGASALSTIANYPGSWGTKTLPSSQNFPLGGGQSWVAIINTLLAASGMRPLFTDPTTGQWTVQSIPVPASQPSSWSWQGSLLRSPLPASMAPSKTGFPDRKIVLYAGQAYTGDVYNAPNRWVFVQSGLSFQPVAGSGLYIVNNTTTPPSDQNTVGRVVTKVVSLDASGQSDLQAQGDAIVTADLAALEKITIHTAPWPAAGHFDVFAYGHENLPGQQSRRLQAQQWTLPLAGGQMEWDCSVVGLS